MRIVTLLAGLTGLAVLAGPAMAQPTGKIPLPVPRPFDLDATPVQPLLAALPPVVSMSAALPAPESAPASTLIAVAHEATPLAEAVPLPRGGLKAVVAREAGKRGLPFSLVDAVIQIESRYNPKAAHRGNMGLMQISTATARANGFVGEAVHLLDPETNLQFGLKVLASAYQAAKGDVCLTLMRYQSGHLSTHMNAANRVYCGRARALMAKI